MSYQKIYIPQESYILRVGHWFGVRISSLDFANPSVKVCASFPPPFFLLVSYRSYQLLSFFHLSPTMKFSNATPRSTVLCLSLSITTLCLLSLLTIPILLKAGQLSFLVSAGAHVQSKVCGPHRPYDRTYSKYYRYMPELQPPEFTIESMREMTWDERLTTPNGGFLRVQKEDGRTMGYGISMMHHIHCLIMVRDMLTGREMNTEFEVGGELHWAHCLDYMANVSTNGIFYSGQPVNSGPGNSMSCRRYIGAARSGNTFREN